MKIVVYSKNPNYGDLVNLLLWEPILGDIFDDDERFSFIGIGTMISSRPKQGTTEILMGAGVGYEMHPRPTMSNRILYTVRGPLTAKVLKIPLETASIDPAFLLPEIFPAKVSSGQVIFIPHHYTHQRAGDSWRKTCQTLGILYLSPTEEPRTILDALSAGYLCLTEALHGAITCEAYGIPWVPLILGHTVLAFKWHDWCQSIGGEYSPLIIRPFLNDNFIPTSKQRWKNRLYPFYKSLKYLPTRLTEDKDIELVAAKLMAILERPEKFTIQSNPSIKMAAKGRLQLAIQTFAKDFSMGKYRSDFLP